MAYETDMATPGKPEETLTIPVGDRKYATTKRNRAFNSLVATPAAPAAPSNPNARAPRPEAWDQYKQAAADRRLLKHNDEQAHKVYAVIDSMMAGLVMSHGELLRLRAALRNHFYDDVSVNSVEQSYMVLP